MTGARYALLAGALATTASSIACVCTLQGTNGGLVINVDASARSPGSLHRLEVTVRNTGLLGISSETLSLGFVTTAGGGIACTPDPELDRCFVAGEHYTLTEAFTFDEPPANVFAFNVVEQGSDDVPPARALIRILDESGAVLVEQEVTPAYETREVNGPGCGKTGNASTMIVVP